MTKVFIVTSGEYSDYGIRAVFSTEAGAKEYANAMRSQEDAYVGSVDIEEWDLDLPRDGWHTTTVHMKKDGACHVTTDFGRTHCEGKPRLNRIDGGMIIEFSGTDTERAIKRANEIRTQLIALGRWGENK